MKIKKGDNVILVAGKDSGKTGKVLKAMPKEAMVIVEGLNLKKKHQKSKVRDQKGQMVEFAAPLHVSNVMIVIDGKRVRIGSKVVGDKKLRINKKTGKAI